VLTGAALVIDDAPAEIEIELGVENQRAIALACVDRDGDGAARAVKRGERRAEGGKPNLGSRAQGTSPRFAFPSNRSIAR